MRVDFLMSPDLILAKRFTPITRTPYPQAYLFTSLSEYPTTLQAFFAHINAYACQGGCLLKGRVKVPLVHESRADSTDRNEATEWMCLDIDRTDPAIQTPEEFIQRCLPPEFTNVSYIWQWSNSAQITKKCLCGHFFFMLDQPINPVILKRLIMLWNFKNPTLDAHIKLSHNGCTLSYGLDPTVAQNDKLIFIAPPILEDIVDPFPTSRISLKLKEKMLLTINQDALDLRVIENLTKLKINALREELGLPKRAGKYKTTGNTEYLKNPEKAVFRGPYIEARGFRYGNLNDGDSYAYYHPIDRPVYLFNFKGEPIVKLADIDPEYYASIQTINSPKVKPDTHYFIIHEPVRDIIATVEHDKTTNTYECLTVDSMHKAKNFLLEANIEPKETIPRWSMVFEPHKDYVIDYENQKINLFQKSIYLKNASRSEICPKKFYELTLHVVGHDNIAHDDLLNWLAFIIQRRQKTNTAFLLHGRTGTGKGVLFHNVLCPILGKEYCMVITMADLDSGFNEWMEKALLVLVNEAQINDDRSKGKSRHNKIKNLITEPVQPINAKFQGLRNCQNFTSFVFAANENDAVTITDDDRRFKVPPRQENPIPYTQVDLDEIKDELQAITNYLLHRPINEKLVYNTHLTLAKERLIEASKDSYDQFADILRKGDLTSVLCFSEELETIKNMAFKARFMMLADEWKNSLNQPIFISFADLRTLFNYVYNTDIGPARFKNILESRNIQLNKQIINGQLKYGTTIIWRATPELMSITFTKKTPACLGHTVN